MTQENSLQKSDFPTASPPSDSNIALAQGLCKRILGLETRIYGPRANVGWSDKDLIRLQSNQGDARFVVKLPKKPDPESIRITREEGYRAKWVGEQGMGPSVSFVDDETGAFAMHLLEAKSLTSAEIVQRMPEVMDLLHRFHYSEVPEWFRAWDFFDYARRDVELAKKGPYISADDLVLVERVLDRAEGITRVNQSSKACHNDYWSTNILSEGDGKLWCIDFEQTGRGDPLWDIGYLASELSNTPREVAVAYGLHDSDDQLKVVAYSHAAKAWLAAWCGTQSDSWLSYLHECMEKVRDANSQAHW